MFFALVAVCALTHVARDVYEVLKRKQVLKLNRTMFLVMFANMALLWASWSVLSERDPYRLAIPDVLRYAGLALFVAGVALFLVGTLRTLESEDNDLVTRGIYSKIRHPMYLAFMLWLVGLPLFYGGVVSFALAPLFIANVLLWRNIEERQLERRFVAYREYKRATLF
jgi:protein-S-isoprenylcysteine O-methyltransferase Ste14